MGGISMEQFNEMKNRVESKSKTPKYRNKKVEYKGLKFDSIKEYEHYLYLSSIEKDGKISKLERQITYPLYINDILICKYIADFQYKDEAGATVVVDVKSSFTKKLPVYKIKKKLMLSILNIEIKEV